MLCGCDGLTTRARDDRRAPPPHQETWAWARESSQSAVLGPRCRLGRLRRCAPASRNAWTVMRRELETWRPEICVRRIITKADDHDDARTTYGCLGNLCTRYLYGMACA